MNLISRFLPIVLFAFASNSCAATPTAPEVSKEMRLASPVKLPFERLLPGSITNHEIMRAESGPGTEYLIRTQRLTEKGFILKGIDGRSAAHDKPWMLVRHITSRKGIGVSIAYSGNWQIQIVQHGSDTLFRVTTLPESLVPFMHINGLPIPGTLVADFSGNWDNGAQAITRFIRKKLLRDLGNNWPLLMYNNWFDRKQFIEEPHLLELVDVAADLGCELFVIDAGWYGKHTNEIWGVSLGDWTVNPERLPNGIEPIEREVRRRGMKFGLWVEIECANPASRLAQQHPDWFLRDGDKRATTRAVLDFGKPEVLDWAKSTIDRLVTTYRLDYIKMDFNTNIKINHPRYPGLSDPIYNHYKGLANLWQYMHKQYPKLVIENCASGSQRQDVMTAALTDTGWVSDDIHPARELAMNFGATYLFPPEICNHWTCIPDWSGGANADAADMQARFVVNMTGQFGYSGSITTWSKEALSYAGDCAKLYKKLRPIIRNADVFHLTDQADLKHPASVEALQYFDRERDKIIIFAFQGNAASLTADIKLRDLQANRVYKIVVPKGFSLTFPGTMTGKELMEDFKLVFPHKGASAIILIEPQRN